MEQITLETAKRRRSVGSNGEPKEIPKTRASILIQEQSINDKCTVKTKQSGRPANQLLGNMPHFLKGTVYHKKDHYITNLHFSRSFLPGSGPPPGSAPQCFSCPFQNPSKWWVWSAVSVSSVPHYSGSPLNCSQIEKYYKILSNMFTHKFRTLLRQSYNILH